MTGFMPLDRSVIFAADIKDRGLLKDIVQEVATVPALRGCKVGFMLGLRGLELAARIAIDAGLVVIYDHQKGGTDIPGMDKGFAEVLAEAGVQAGILFPLSGPATLEKWATALLAKGIVPIVGGHMTHPKFLRSEGGWVDDNAPAEIYELAATELGVRDFVVPGNKVPFVEKYRGQLDRLLGAGEFSLFAPGFVTQGGDVSETAQVAGSRWHAIAGSGIYKAEDRRAAALALTSQIAQAAV